ncbi:DUF3592 domain-containing protein [Marinimicrobium alkaliphilum]|uniref:DUF3592 domain-containing protein n=1 Tax=Marinimicrobium alkaliphilum TaxID=2202654 RepID=UPI000DB9B419|nr:DUF3592 domain-containing protein [Marinimicrobium alkaliphilum]
MFKIILQIGLPLLLAITGLLQTIVYLGLRRKSERWPKVAAVITFSKLLNHMDLDNRNVLEAMIHYKYTFLGKEYEGKTPALRGYDMFPSYDYESKLVKKYRPGDTVNAVVCPRAPELCYLEVAPLSKVSTVMAPLFFILGVALFLAYFWGVWDILYDMYFWRI